VGEVQVYTPREAADIALAGYTELRDEVRQRAHDAFGDEKAPVRAALLEAVFLMDRWRDVMLARFGVESPAGAAGPVLRDVDFPAGSELQVGRVVANRGRTFGSRGVGRAS
jgi:hypothetical protein